MINNSGCNQSISVVSDMDGYGIIGMLSKWTDRYGFRQQRRICAIYKLTGIVIIVGLHMDLFSIIPSML